MSRTGSRAQIYLPKNPSLSNVTQQSKQLMWHKTSRSWKMIRSPKYLGRQTHLLFMSTLITQPAHMQTHMACNFSHVCIYVASDSPSRDWGFQLEDKPPHLTATVFWSTWLSPVYDMWQLLWQAISSSSCFLYYTTGLLGTLHLIFHHLVDHGSGLETS